MLFIRCQRHEARDTRVGVAKTSLSVNRTKLFLEWIHSFKFKFLNILVEINNF